jgi:hypothetical protein
MPSLTYVFLNIIYTCHASLKIDFEGPPFSRKLTNGRTFWMIQRDVDKHAPGVQPVEQLPTLSQCLQMASSLLHIDT